jgi:hypothetical protein
MTFIFIRALAIIIGLISFSKIVNAADIEALKTALPPASTTNSVLVIETPFGKKQLNLADLERLPMKQSTIRTSFGMSGTFQGIMLSDLLAAYGLTNTNEITLIASDDYAAVVSKSELRASPALLATRLNGKTIDDPTRGPLILLWPYQEQAALTGEKNDSEWIWSVVKIRAKP